LFCSHIMNDQKTIHATVLGMRNGGKLGKNQELAEELLELLDSDSLVETYPSFKSTSSSASSTLSFVDTSR